MCDLLNMEVIFNLVNLQCRENKCMSFYPSCVLSFGRLKLIKHQSSPSKLSGHTRPAHVFLMFNSSGILVGQNQIGMLTSMFLILSQVKSLKSQLASLHLL